jgi:hypothetical protein
VGAGEVTLCETEADPNTFCLKPGSYTHPLHCC